MSLRRPTARLSMLATAAVALQVLGAGCGKPDAQAHVTRADAYVEKKQLPEAIVEYRAALQAEPNLGEVRLKLGNLYAEQGNGGEALREYVRAADLLPTNVDAQIKAGSLLLLAGQLQDAKTRASKAIELDGSNALAQILLGNTMAGLKDFSGAIDQYQEALTLNPKDDVAYRNIATVQAATGHNAEAEVAFRKAVDVAPKSAQARMALANFLWATSRVADAEQVFKDALALDPTNETANRALGSFYIGSNRVAEAEPYFKAIADRDKTAKSAVGLADYYIAAKKYEEARSLLRDAAKDKTQYAPATLRLAAIDSALGQRSEAHIKLRQVLELHPKEMTARFFEARLLLADGKPAEALAIASSIAKDDPGSTVAAESQLMVGLLQSQLDRPEDAIKAFEDALRRRPGQPAAQLALARLQMAKGAFDKAEQYAKDALSGDPKNPIARAELVRIYLAKGDANKAKEDLAGLRKEFPNAVAVLLLTASQQLLERQVPQARATYERALQGDPGNVEAMTALVGLDLATNRQAEAIKRVETALKDPTPPSGVYVLAARVYSATGDAKKTEAMLLKAIEREPQRMQAYSLLGTLYARQNRLAEATTKFEEVVAHNPSSVSGGSMLGMLLDARGKTADAEREYRRVLALDPEAPVAANNLAWIYISSGRNVGEAFELAKTALRRLPDEPNVNDTLGWIYFKQGQTSTAIKHLEASIAKAPELASTHYHLGMAYASSGDPDKARESLTRALSFRQEFDGIADARKKLAELGGAS
jgi:cellulose synthase operon protein C